MILFLFCLTLHTLAVSSAKDFDLHTTDELKYTYYEWKGPTLKFKVKASNDAHLIFSKSTDPDLGSNDQFVEVVMGGWNNGQSVIRKSRSETGNVVTQTPGLLNPGEFRGFWAKVIKNGFMIGKEFESVPFMSFTDANPINITHYGLCTGFGSSGDWKVSENFDVKVDTPCAPDDAQAAVSPWDGGPVQIVKQTCFDMLADQCQGKLVQDRIPAGKKSYIVQSEMKTWDEAKAACETAGHRLASVRSNEDQLLLETAIKNYRNPFSGVWIAANDRAQFDHFVWESARDPVTYTNWENSLLPRRDHDSGKNCVFVSYVALVVKKHAYWFVQKCNTPWHYVCEQYEVVISG